jgi:hypothetical protein
MLYEITDVPPVQSLLNDIVQNYPSLGKKKLAIVTTGAGGFWGALITIPGSSATVHDIYIPYATEATEALKPDPTVKMSSVSLDSLQVFRDYIDKKWGDTVVKVVCTGGLITNRFRKSDDHAYISVDDNVYHIKFNKMTEEEYNKVAETSESLAIHRMVQDNFVMNVISCLLMDREINQFNGVTIEKL